MLYLLYLYVQYFIIPVVTTPVCTCRGGQEVFSGTIGKLSLHFLGSMLVAKERMIQISATEVMNKVCGCSIFIV